MHDDVIGGVAHAVIIIKRKLFRGSYQDIYELVMY